MSSVTLISRRVNVNPDDLAYDFQSCCLFFDLRLKSGPIDIYISNWFYHNKKLLHQSQSNIMFVNFRNAYLAETSRKLLKIIPSTENDIFQIRN